MVDTAGGHTAVLADMMLEQQQRRNKDNEEDGDEDDEQGCVFLHAVVDSPQSLYFYIGCLHVTVEVGGEGGGGKGVGLEELHFADVGVGLHVHAAGVEEEGLW